MIFYLFRAELVTNSTKQFNDKEACQALLFEVGIMRFRVFVVRIFVFERYVGLFIFKLVRLGYNTFCHSPILPETPQIMTSERIMPLIPSLDMVFFVSLALHWFFDLVFIADLVPQETHFA